MGVVHATAWELCTRASEFGPPVRCLRPPRQARTPRRAAATKGHWPCRRDERLAGYRWMLHGPRRGTGRPITPCDRCSQGLRTVAGERPNEGRIGPTDQQMLGPRSRPGATRQVYMTAQVATWIVPRSLLGSSPRMLMICPPIGQDECGSVSCGSSARNSRTRSGSAR